MLAHDPYFAANIDSPRIRGHWQQFLENVRTLFADHDRQPSCFISYAWPPAGEGRDRLQQRLKHFKQDLETLGATVYLDITNLTSDINGYMDKLKACDHALLIGTPKLKARLSESKANNAKYEFTQIQAQQTLHPDFILPLLFEGDFSNAFPAEIGNVLIRDFRLSTASWAQGHDTYMQNMTSFAPLGLIPVIFNLKPDSAKGKLYQVLVQQLMGQLQALRDEHTRECNHAYQQANEHAMRADYAGAVNYYQQAANRLHAAACYRIGFFYEAADHELIGARPLPQDNTAALQWLKRGAAFGHVKSMIQVAERIGREGRDTQQAELIAEALHHASEAVRFAEQRDRQQAQLTLSKVQRYYAEYLAHHQRDPEAMLRVAEHLWQSTGGIETPKTDEAKRLQYGEALRLAQLARQQGVQTADMLISALQNQLDALTPLTYKP